VSTPWEVVVRRRRFAAVVGLSVLLGALLVVGVDLSGPEGAASPTGSVPEAVTVTVVGEGETLSDVARRSVPRAEAEATMSRIRALNALPDSSVRAGRPLTVPVG